MNIVFIIPTGIGCSIGGHAGDGTPAAKLIASCCNNLIIHPNVVNASDINEMTDNMWYVEGSILNKFLSGKINLKRPTNYNKILLAVNRITADVVNSVSAARATIGADIEILKLKTPLIMLGSIKDNKAIGIVTGWEDLIYQVGNYKFDALAIATPISIEKGVAIAYLKNPKGINPWGGVEAIASKLIAEKLHKPVAHSPMDDFESDSYKEMLEAGIVDSRMAAELVSISYLHCVLKGLHKAPRVVHHEGLSCNDINVMVSPASIYGEPHRACYEKQIPIIYVKENKTCLDRVVSRGIVVENYLEAAGLIQAWAAGVSIQSIRRPLPQTIIHGENK